MLSPIVFACVVGLAVLACVVLWFARRGRRTGDEPRCRKCGFDLTGKPETSTRCPECGADVTAPRAVVTGRREPRRALAWASVAVFLPSLLATAVLAYRHYQTIEWIRYRPVTWLVEDAVHPSGQRALPALVELQRRASEKALNDGQWWVLVEAGLKQQADFTTPFNPIFGQLIEDGRQAGKTSDRQWSAYARTAALSQQFKLRIRQKVKAGDPVPIDFFDHQRERIRGALLPVTYTFESFIADDRIDLLATMPNLRLPGRTQIEVELGGGTIRHRLIDSYNDTLRTLPAGPHRLAIKAIGRVYDVQPDSIWMNSGEGTPIGEPLATFETSIEGAFEVVTDDAAAGLTFVDPAQRAAVRSGTTIDSVRRRGNELTIKLTKTTGTPRREYVACVRVRPDGPLVRPTQYSGTIFEGAGQTVIRMTLMFGPEAVPTSDTVDVVLVPDLDAARLSFETDPIWGETVEYTGLPVTIDEP